MVQVWTAEKIFFLSFSRKNTCTIVSSKIGNSPKYFGHPLCLFGTIPNYWRVKCIIRSAYIMFTNWYRSHNGVCMYPHLLRPLIGKWKAQASVTIFELWSNMLGYVRISVTFNSLRRLFWNTLCFLYLYAVLDYIASTMYAVMARAMVNEYVHNIAYIISHWGNTRIIENIEIFVSSRIVLMGLSVPKAIDCPQQHQTLI